MRTHILVRTSPKGEPFVGDCTLCGATDLPFIAGNEPCDNDLLSPDERLVEAIKGEPQ